MLSLLVDGMPTGLIDSNKRQIKIGDLIKRPVYVNNDFHGNWAIYRVKAQGVVPILSYVKSEKGQKLPEGYTACLLSDEYDLKMFVFATNISELEPDNKLTVIDKLE